MGVYSSMTYKRISFNDCAMRVDRRSAPSLSASVGGTLPNPADRPVIEGPIAGAPVLQASGFDLAKVGYQQANISCRVRLAASSTRSPAERREMGSQSRR